MPGAHTVAKPNCTEKIILVFYNVFSKILQKREKFHFLAAAAMVAGGNRLSPTGADSGDRHGGIRERRFIINEIFRLSTPSNLLL